MDIMLCYFYRDLQIKNNKTIYQTVKREWELLACSISAELQETEDGLI